MENNLVLEEIKIRVNNYSKEEAKERLNELYKKADYYSNLYYNEDNPAISDFDYDMLTQEIRKIEEKYPKLKKEDEAVNKVGGAPSTLFNKVNLEVPMQSLMDVFSFEEVESFLNKILKEEKDTDFVVETKIDGLSVSLTYNNNELVLASTRGDGIVGEDITDNIKMVDSIPKKIPYDGKLILRGEVYISKKDFKDLITAQEERGEKIFANPRNAAAGSLRQKDSSKIKERNLSIYIFNVQYSDKKFSSHYDSLQFVKSLGIDINYYVKKIEGKDIKEKTEKVKEAIEEIHEKRKELGFEIDGAVIKVDDLNLRKTLGQTAKVPRWAVAYKYPAEQKETTLKDIIFNTSRTGTITPIAVLDRVLVDGSMIERASLHNFDYIKEKDLRINDRVILQKAGDIIPEIVRAIKEKRDGSEKEVDAPKVCPVCGSITIKENMAIKCINDECPSKVHKKIEHFASKNAMNIEGLAEKNIKILLDKGLIKDIPDIYLLKEEDFLGLKKNGKKYAKNMYESIQKSKENPLHRLLNAIGIPNIGITAAKKLAKEYKNLEKLMNASKEELVNIQDIGEITAENIEMFFKDEKTKEMLNRLVSYGINTKEPESNEEESEKLKDLTFVITGSFDIKREEIKDIIEKNGGKVSSSVSSKTNYLVKGENAGSKLTKAESLNINIVTFKEVLKMIEE